MIEVSKRLAEIAEIDDEAEQNERLEALYEELAAGPWRKALEARAAGNATTPDVDQFYARAEEKMRRYLETEADPDAPAAEPRSPARRHH